MPTKKTPPKRYTITEAAETLGISRQAVHSAIKTGQLKARLGKIVTLGWLIAEAALQDYEQSPKQRNRAPKKRRTKS